jgi:hypothetical protein
MSDRFSRVGGVVRVGMRRGRRIRGRLRNIWNRWWYEWYVANASPRRCHVRLVVTIAYGWVRRVAVNTWSGHLRRRWLWSPGLATMTMNRESVEVGFDGLLFLQQLCQADLDSVHFFLVILADTLSTDYDKGSTLLTLSEHRTYTASTTDKAPALLAGICPGPSNPQASLAIKLRTVGFQERRRARYGRSSSSC